MDSSVGVGAGVGKPSWIWGKSGGCTNWLVYIYGVDIHELEWNREFFFFLPFVKSIALISPSEHGVQGVNVEQDQRILPIGFPLLENSSCMTRMKAR